MKIEYRQMNYVSQRRALGKLLRKGLISHQAEALYTRIFDLFNEDESAAGDLWPAKLQISSYTLAGLMSASVASFERARKELIEKGLIKYKPGVGSAPGWYELVKLYQDMSNIEGASLKGADEPAPSFDEGAPHDGEAPAQSEIADAEIEPNPALGADCSRFVHGLSSVYPSPVRDKSPYIYPNQAKQTERDSRLVSLSHFSVKEGFERFKAAYPRKCEDTEKLKVPENFNFDLLRQKVSESDFLTECLNLHLLIKYHKKVFADDYKRYQRTMEKSSFGRNYTKAQWDAMIDDVNDISF